MMDRRTFLRTAFVAAGASALSIGLPAGLSKAALGVQEAQITALAYQGTSITVGPPVSLRTLSAAWAQEFATDEWTFPAFDFSRSGTKSWNALARIGRVAECNPAFVQIDWRNDRVTAPADALTREAWIRRMRTLLPDANLFMTVWPWVSANGTIGELPPESVAYMALCDRYGVPYINAHTAIRNLLQQGHSITEYYNWPTDYTHPLTAGHRVAWNMLRQTFEGLLFGERQYGAKGSLPDRMSDCTEYEHGTEMYAAATTYIARTGAWSNTPAGIYSNQPGATVTYAFTGCSVGVERSYAEFHPPQYVDYRIDGGPWLIEQPMNGNGLRVADYGAHTIEMRVRSELAIDHFLAI